MVRRGQDVLEINISPIPSTFSEVTSVRREQRPICSEGDVEHARRDFCGDGGLEVRVFVPVPDVEPLMVCSSSGAPGVRVTQITTMLVPADPYE